MTTYIVVDTKYRASELRFGIYFGTIRYTKLGSSVRKLGTLSKIQAVMGSGISKCSGGAVTAACMKL